MRMCTLPKKSFTGSHAVGISGNEREFRGSTVHTAGRGVRKAEFPLFSRQHLLRPCTSAGASQLEGGQLLIMMSINMYSFISSCSVLQLV